MKSAKPVDTKTAPKPDEPKAEVKDTPRYDPIQERAPDRDVTKLEDDKAKAEKADKPISRRAEIEQQMEANNLWISQHRDDTEGVQKREAANAELTHRLIDLDVAGSEAGRKLRRMG